MTDREWLDKFSADLEKLKHNREKVPLQELTTKYAKAYNTLVAEVIQDADWWAAAYINLVTGHLPRHPEDKAGNDWLRQRIEAILQQERQTGGRFDRYRAAIIDRLNRDEFEQLVWEIYDRIEREAYLPYWFRHCSLTGEPGKRWTYNDILKMFWCPPERRPDHWKEKGYFKGGCWISHDWKKQDSRYPPPDSTKEE